MTVAPPATADPAAKNPLSGVVDARHLQLVTGAAGRRDEERREANATLAAGLGLGAFSVASLAFFGATCPLCVVAAPVLVSVGLYKRCTAPRRR